MDSEVETESPPPVSSLRSRWEAMSRKADAPDESKGVKPRILASNVSRRHGAEDRPSTPKVIVSPVSSSGAHNVPLRRVVSTPTSQPTSPEAVQSTFSSPNSPHRSPCSSMDVRTEGIWNGDEGEGDETPNSATPRRSPSTPSFNFGSGNKGLGIGLGPHPGFTASGKKIFSVSSSAGVTSTGMNSAGPHADSAVTDAERLSRKLSRRPPPPPPGRKPPPPLPPSRSPEGTVSHSSSRSATPSADSDDTRQKAPHGPHIHLGSDSSGSTPLLNLAPPFPARTIQTPTLTPRLNVIRSPALPPRSVDGPTANNTLVYHQNREFRTPSTENLSPAGSDGSETSKPHLVPPKLPSRSGNNSMPASPAVPNGPPLPKRNHLATGSLSDQSIPLPPRLPPRSAGGSVPDPEEQDSEVGSTRVETEIGRGRRIPPPPSHSLRPTPAPSGSPTGSRESLTLGEATFQPPPPPQRTPSGDSFLPPPARVIHPVNDGLSYDHHHRHFLHLPHQLNSLPITKMLASVRLGGHRHSNSGSKSPHSHISPSLEPSNEPTGTAGLPPPPIRNVVGPNSSTGKHDQDDELSSDEFDDSQSGTGNGTIMGGGGIKRPAAKVAEELPDSSRSNRRPPILSEFQHPPATYAAHHHFVSVGDGVKGTGIHVPSPLGVVAVAGWWVVVASSGVITVTNMNVADRERGSGPVDWDQTEEMGIDLAMGISPIAQITAGAKGVWTIEMKDMPIDWKVEKPRVTAIEFRHGSSRPLSRSSTNLSRNSSRTAVNHSSNLASDTSDEGRYVWCGTRDGCLFELDVWNGGKMTDLRVGVHSGHVTGIFRLPGHRMVTVDEHGKCLVFCSVGVARSEENLGATNMGDGGGWLSRANPRVHRIMHREGFMRVLNGRLWTSPAALLSSGSSAGAANANGSGESMASVLGSGGSLASIAQVAAKQHRQNREQNHRPHRNESHTSSGPHIRIHEIDDDGALVTKTVTPGHNVGVITCGTVLPSTPGIVYLGHEGGHVTVWGWGDEVDAQKSATSARLPWQRHQSQASLTSEVSTSSCSDEGESHTEEESPISAAREKGVLRCDAKGPVCLKKVKVSISDVISLEGVGSRIWAGTRKGLIYAYDVSGDSDTARRRFENGDSSGEAGGVGTEQRPWVVTNVWKAHGELPVARIVVDPYSVAKTQKLVVYSIGRDEVLRFWDGFLSQNWIDSEMLVREASFCTFRPLKMLMCTWNVDAAKPDALIGINNATFLQKFLVNPALGGSRPDIIVFGFQEVIDLEDKKLTAKTVLLGTGKKRADGSISAKVSRHYRLWHDRLVSEVQRAYPEESYIVQHTENLVGLFTCVFVRRELAKSATGSAAVRDISVTTIKCGMHGMYGNKGAIVARFTVDDSSVCFLNCHLAAGQSQKVTRNMDLASVLEEKSVFPVPILEDGTPLDDFAAYVRGGDGSMVLDHELCFLNGDLNYRIDQRRDAVISNIQAGKLDHLLQYDQLLHEMRNNPTFRLHTFTEPPITFAPTYKYDRQSNTYDTSEKRRIPAWCDRILHRSRDPSRVENLWYGRYEPDISDHRPVCGVYRLIVKKIAPEKRVKEMTSVRKLWEKELVRLCAEARSFYEGQ